MTYPRLVMFAAVVIVVAALYLAQAVLMPVALAIFLCFVLSPLVGRLEHWRLGRVPSVLIVALFAFAAIASVGWVVGHEAKNLVTRLPEFRENLESKLAFVRETLHGPLQRASDAVQQIEGGASSDASAKGGQAPAAANWATVSYGTLLSWFGMSGVVVLLVIIMLIRRGDVRDRFIALAGGGVGVVTTQALDEAAQRVSRFLLVLTIINAAYGTLIGLGLWLIGVPNCLLWGILAGALRFIPYVGPWIAAAIPILFSFAINATLTTPILTCVLFVALEILTGMVIEPTVLPKHIGVSTTALVVSAVFWTWLWGLPGLVLATPLTVCVAVMGKHIPRMRFLSVILGDQSVLSPSLRIYQRLLVDDAEEAWGLVSADLRSGKSVVEVYDSLLLPALCLAQQDRRDRVIDEPTLVKVIERANELAEEVIDRGPATDAVPKDASPKEVVSEALDADEPVPADPAIALQDPLHVVCIAAEKGSDGAASSMLCALLQRAGCDASEAPQGAAVSEALTAIAAANADAVCVSQVPPLSFTRLRYVCKRIAQRFPGKPILVGTWTISLDPTRAQERLESDGQLQVAGTLAEMLQQVERIALLARATPQPEPPSEAPPKSRAEHASVNA